MGNGAIQQKFTAALDALIEQVRGDHSILAAILCGSLSYDMVWARSDIDLVLVTIDGKKMDPAEIALYADGVKVHAFLIPRAEFRRTVEGSVRNSFMHSLLAKGRLLYTHDQTIADLCARLHEIGARDTEVQLLRAATSALPLIDKAHKWFTTRGDLDYTALWILYAATPLAAVEVIGARLVADREVIPQALRLNPAFFKTIDADLLNAPKTPQSVETALEAVDRYVAAARLDAVRTRDRASARGRRSAVIERDRGPLQTELRPRRRDHGLRVPGRPGADRRSLDARPPHEEGPRRGAGACIFLHEGLKL
jgi:hypothetical protein